MQARASRWTRLSQSTPFRYGLALVVTALALEARQLLDPYLGDYTPYITLYGGIAVLSIYAGIGPALFSAVLGLVGVLYWFMPPRHTFVFWSNSAHPVSVIAYLAVCGLIAAAGELSRKLKRDLESSRILFETFLDNSPGTEFLKDASTGKYVYVNKTGKARFSKNPVGRTDFELFPGSLAANFREQEFKVMWQNEPHEFTSTTQEADGEHTWLTLMFPVLDPQGSKLLGGKVIDITAQQRAEQEIARLHQERGSRDAADLEVMTRLHELGITCLQDGSSQSECLQAILETAIFISSADKGNIQLFEEASESLRIAAQRGFEDPFLRYFASVRDVASTRGEAMQSARRVVVEDVTQSELYAGSPSLDILLGAGVRAVQSTPLVSSTSDILGMISVYFSQPHRPSERELRFIDLLSRQAADYLTRKKTEQALRESEERVRLAAASAQFGTYDANHITQERFWSPELRSLVGLEQNESTGDFHEPPKFVHPDDKGRVNQKMMASHDPKGSGILEHEHRVLRPDGTVRWVLVKGRTFFEGEGEMRHPVRSMGIVLDITDRKRGEMERAQLAAIVESSDDAIYTYDFEGVIRSWNQGAQKLYGWSADEIVGRSISAIIPPEKTGEAREQIIPAIQGGATVVNQETLRMRRDGSVFCCLLTASPVRDAEGNAIAVSIIVRDITHSKRTEAALSDAFVQLQQLLDAVPIGLTRCSRDLRYLSANPAYAQIAGLPVDQIVGKPIIEVMGLPAWETIRPHVERVLQGERVEYETVLPFAQSGSRYLHVVYTPEKDDEQRVTGWIASVADVTEFKQLQEKLRDQDKSTDQEPQLR